MQCLLLKDYSLKNILDCGFQGVQSANINESFARKCNPVLLARSKYFEEFLARSKILSNFLARSIDFWRGLKSTDCNLVQIYLVKDYKEIYDTTNLLIHCAIY